MKRLVLLIALVGCSPIAAELNVVARLEDPRITERKVYLRWEKTTSGELSSITCYLPAKAGVHEKQWEVLFENDEVMRVTIEICSVGSPGKQCMVRGREVVTLRGRGLLIEFVRSNW